MKFSLAEETLGYVTAPDPSNTDFRLLVAGSQNVLIDYQKKVAIRPGYTRLGMGNSALTEIRNAWTWETSKGTHLPQRFYDDELEVFLSTVDGVTIDAWKRVKDSWSTTEMLRSITQHNLGGSWYDSTEKEDLQLMVQGDANIYEWNGGVAVASSVSALSITEAGDASNQLSAWSFSGLNASNSNLGVLYYTLTNSVSTRTVNIYKDSAGSNLVATGSRSGDGVITLAASGGSGLTGSVTVAYSGDDTTTSANTLTCAYTLTKAGTTTFGENRFYTSRNKNFVNSTSGVDYTYVSTVASTTLSIIPTSAAAVDIVSGDFLMQTVVTHSDKPGSSRTNHFIYCFENQILIGSEDDNLVYISKNSDFTDFTFSSPRVSGEGALLTLDSPTRAFGSIGKFLVIFAGFSSVYKGEYEQIAVGSTLAETIKIKKLNTGIKQGALNQESIVPLGDSISYLSNETALRIISNPESLVGTDPKTFSNPIKPDFDAEDWTSAFGFWYKNLLIYTAPATSHMYILAFVQDADGNLKRFWNPPQILPVGPMSIIDSGDGPALHGHSNVVPESYLLFDGQSDGQYPDMDVADKLPINAAAAFAYNGYKNRAVLKTFDEYYVEGEITPSTTNLGLLLNYDFEGETQQINKTIDGSDDGILEGLVGQNSLGQASLALNPLGGLLNPPENTKKFRVVFEIAREDFHQMQPVFSTDDTDKYWAIITHGANATLSPRRNTSIRR